MKNRPKGFLSEAHISHESEIFDYIRELHGYLWRFVRTQYPDASGTLTDWVDHVIDEMEENEALFRMILNCKKDDFKGTK